MRHGEKDYVELAGDMVRRAREKYLKVSQTRFGEMLGGWVGRPAVSRGQVGKYESGAQKIPAFYLLALKDLLIKEGVTLSLDALFDEVDETSLRAEIAELRRLIEGGDQK